MIQRKILMVSSERSGSDPSEYLFQIKQIYFHLNQLSGDKLTFFIFFSWNIYKVQWFYKFRWLHWKYFIKIYQTITSFYPKKCLKLILNRFLLVKKWKIQVIASMIIFTRSSEWIFNQMRYIGIILVDSTGIHFQMLNI